MKAIKYFLSIFLLIFLITSCGKQTTQSENDTVPSVDEIITDIQKGEFKLWSDNFRKESLKIYKNEHTLIEYIRAIYRKNPRTKPNDVVNKLKKLAELGEIEKLSDIEKRYTLRKCFIKSTINIFAESLYRLMQDKNAVNTMVQF